MENRFKACQLPARIPFSPGPATRGRAHRRTVPDSGPASTQLQYPKCRIDARSMQLAIGKDAGDAVAIAVRLVRHPIAAGSGTHCHARQRHRAHIRSPVRAAAQWLPDTKNGDWKRLPVPVTDVRRDYASISYPLRLSRERNELACGSPIISRLTGSHFSSRPSRIAMFER